MCVRVNGEDGLVKYEVWDEVCDGVVEFYGLVCESFVSVSVMLA